MAKRITNTERISIEKRIDFKLPLEVYNQLEILADESHLDIRDVLIRSIKDSFFLRQQIKEGNNIQIEKKDGKTLQLHFM